MAYSASIPVGQQIARRNIYRKTRPRGLIRGTFRVLIKFLGASFLLLLSLGFIILISMALLYGYSTAMNSDYFGLKEIKITGNTQLTYSQLTELMNVSPGDSILQLNMSDLHAKLGSNHWIQEVSIKRVFPDRLVINLKERQAYFWLQNQDKLYYADENARIITSISPGRYVSLPILFFEGERRDHDLISVVGFLENRSFPFSLQDISWIRAKQSGTVEIFIDSKKLNISLDRETLNSGPERLNRVWSDLGARAETDSAERIIVAGRNAWVGFRSQEQEQAPGE